MYQNGAESAALNAIMSTSDFFEVHQLCDYVKMWHFHSEPKTHYNDDEKFVTHLYSYAAECHSLQDCLNPGRGDYQAQKTCYTRNKYEMEELLGFNLSIVSKDKVLGNFRITSYEQELAAHINSGGFTSLRGHIN